MHYQKTNFRRSLFSRKIVNSSEQKQSNGHSATKYKSVSETKSQSSKLKIYYENDIQLPKRQILTSNKHIQTNSFHQNKFSLPSLQKKPHRLQLSNNKTKNFQESGISVQNCQKRISLPYGILFGSDAYNLNYQKSQENSKITNSFEKFSFLQKIQNSFIQQKYEQKQKQLSKSQSSFIINQRNKELFDLNLRIQSHLYRASAFQIKSVFSIIIENKPLKFNFSCQTQNLHKQYDDFLKFKQIFDQSFGKLQKIVQQFNNQKHLTINNQKIVKQLQQKQSEFNIQRQRRVISLQIQIQQARKATVKALKQLRRQQEVQYKAYKKRTSLMDNTAYHNNFKYAYSFVNDFESKFNNWRALIHENKILIYNCVKQLQKIPELLLKIFQPNKNSINLTYSSTQQQKIKEFLKLKCLKCFQTNRNIGFIQQKCQKVRPIIKALQNLLNISNRSLFAAQSQNNIKMIK